jgi:SAM-dependent methyltransferase
MRPTLQPNAYQSHLETAHNIWRSIITPGDIVIDATCGNGRDTQFLAHLLFSNENISGMLYAIDIQSEAIASAQKLIEGEFSKDKIERIRFVESCHSKFPFEVAKGSVKLIVYNLGYLPGGNKELTTMLDTTMLSIREALELLQESGMISITCYPGHHEGKVEEEVLQEFAKGLDPKKWICSHQKWINRQKAPSLLLISKRKNTITNAQRPQRGF